MNLPTLLILLAVLVLLVLSLRFLLRKGNGCSGCSDKGCPGACEGCNKRKN